MDSESTVGHEKVSSEKEIQELAKKELLRDIKCAAMRAEQFGAHSWAKPQKYVPSKRFLRHMLVSASRENHRKTDRWRNNKTSKSTPASVHQSQKHDSVSEQDNSLKRKRSRWDSSPQHSQSNPPHRHEKKEKRHHHHHHHHHRHHHVKTK